MFKVIGIVLLIVLLLVFGPLLTIWALNTLFPALNIDYTWQTWAAVILLGGAIRGSAK